MVPLFFVPRWSRKSGTDTDLLLVVDGVRIEIPFGDEWARAWCGCLHVFALLRWWLVW